jgi:hypothetical protein
MADEASEAAEAEHHNKHKTFHLFDTQGLSSITDEELEKTELKLCKLPGALSVHNGNYCVVKRLPENVNVLVVSLPVGGNPCEVHLRPSNLRSPRHAPKKQVRTTTKKDNKEKNRTSPKLAFARVSSQLRKGAKMRMKERGLPFMAALHTLFEETQTEDSVSGFRIEAEEFIDCITNLEGVAISKIDANLVCRMFVDGSSGEIQLEKFEELLIADDRTQFQSRKADRFAASAGGGANGNALEPLNQTWGFMGKLTSAGIQERQQRFQVHTSIVRGKTGSGSRNGVSSPLRSASGKLEGLTGSPTSGGTIASIASLDMNLKKMLVDKHKGRGGQQSKVSGGGSSSSSPLPPLKSTSSSPALTLGSGKGKQKRYELQQFEKFYATEGEEMKRKEFFTDSAAIKWYWSKQRRLKQIQRPTCKIQNRNHIGHQL